MVCTFGGEWNGSRPRPWSISPSDTLYLPYRCCSGRNRFPVWENIAFGGDETNMFMMRLCRKIGWASRHGHWSCRELMFVRVIIGTITVMVPMAGSAYTFGLTLASENQVIVGTFCLCMVGYSPWLRPGDGHMGGRSLAWLVRFGIRWTGGWSMVIRRASPVVWIWR